MASQYRCMHCQMIVPEGCQHNCAKARDELIEAVKHATADYFSTMGIKVHIEPMEIGERVLAYLKGDVDFVTIGERGPYEPPTCGTGHLIAERVLRIVENGVKLGDPVPDDDTLTQLELLADRAGVHFARVSLANDGVPF